MKCLKCDSSDSRVVDSRSVQKGSSIRRRRECNKCSFRFTTYEYILTSPIMVIKKTGEREEYDRKKLEKSFHIACNKRPVPEDKIQNALQNIEDKISNISNIEINADHVGELVMEELHNIDNVAFIRFASVYREFKDIGEFQAQIDDLNK